MEDNQLAEKSYDLIQKDFGLDMEFDASLDNPMMRLENFITSIVAHLLEKDFNRLLNALYRIDINEEKVKQILELGNPDEMSRDLARAIIQREKQKVALRAKYSG